MHSQVTRQLRMECRHQDRPLAAHHRTTDSIHPGDPGQYLYLRANPFDHRRPNEYGVQWPVKTRNEQVRLEGVHLPAEGVPAHIDVDGTEAGLVRAPVDNVTPEQDHSGAGAECRHPFVQAIP